MKTKLGIISLITLLAVLLCSCEQYYELTEGWKEKRERKQAIKKLEKEIKGYKMLGIFEKALAKTEQAILMNPDNDDYYYEYCNLFCGCDCSHC